MKNKFGIPIIAAVLFGLTACTSDTLTDATVQPTTPIDENVPIGFSSYLGNAKTRAYNGGDISSTAFPNYGFGIFAINTKTVGYTDHKVGTTPTLLSEYDFMFNENVTGTTSGNSTTWNCTTKKYWPNPTYESSEEKPQYVSFFAYAPYVALTSPTTGNTQYTSTQSGIVGIDIYNNIKSNITNTTFNSTDIDPVVEYNTVVGSNSGDLADLLWGTTGTNSNSYNYDASQTGDAYKNLNGGKALTNGKADYKVNADLTKMVVGGTIGFNFKHALASIGMGKIDAVNDKVRTSSSAKTRATDGTTGLEEKNRISVRWIAVEVLPNDGTSSTETTTTTAYPTHGYFDLATGNWAAKSGSGTNSFDPLYLIVPNKDTKNPSTDSKTNAEKALDEYNEFKGLTGNNAISKDNVNVVPMNGEINIGDLTSDYSSYVAQGGWNTTGDNIAKNGVTTTGASPLGTGATSFYVIPSAVIPSTTVATPSVKVTVDYDIVTPDANYDASDEDESGEEGSEEGTAEQKGGFVASHQIQTQKVSGITSIEMGKKYTLNIHLGVTSIKVDASVDNWDTNNTQDADLPANKAGSTTEETSDPEPTEP